MTVPSWHDDAILEPDDANISIADVETGGVGIITQLRLMLVTNGSWTEPSANLFVSPVTGSGVFFDMLFTRIDADTMEVRVRDYLGATLITRRFDIEAAGNTTIDFYTGTSYVWVFTRRATPEGCTAYLLDPEAAGGVDGDQPNRLIANATRTTAGAATVISTGVGFAFHAGVAVSDERALTTYSSSSAAICVSTASSRDLYPPLLMYISQAVVLTFMGCVPGAVFGPGSGGSSVPTDTVKNVPVDTGTKKAFICIPPTSMGTYTGRTLVRKPSVDP